MSLTICQVKSFFRGILEEWYAIPWFKHCQLALVRSVGFTLQS